MKIPPIKQMGPGEEIPNAPINGAAQDVRTVEVLCANCVFFVSADGIRGQCRSHSPHPLVTGLAQGLNPHAPPQPIVQGYFPMTHKDLWCGEFRPAPQKPDG